MNSIKRGLQILLFFNVFLCSSSFAQTIQLGPYDYYIPQEPVYRTTYPYYPGGYKLYFPSDDDPYYGSFHRRDIYDDEDTGSYYYDGEDSRSYFRHGDWGYSGGWSHGQRDWQ